MSIQIKNISKSYKSTKALSEINFSVEKGEMNIAGRSLPQDAYGFFKPITEWMQNFIKNLAIMAGLLVLAGGRRT